MGEHDMIHVSALVSKRGVIFARVDKRPLMGVDVTALLMRQLRPLRYVFPLLGAKLLKRARRLDEVRARNGLLFFYDPRHNGKVKA
jgi:hypothetical protein